MKMSDKTNMKIEPKMNGENKIVEMQVVKIKIIQKKCQTCILVSRRSNEEEEDERI